jgi:hypothetical protein
MKRKIIITVVLCLFAGLTVFNVGLAHRYDNTDTTLDLISVMAKAFDEGEIPPVNIICSYSGTGPTGGRCYDPNNCRFEWTPFGPVRVQDCIDFTGYTLDQCFDGWPCYRDPE